MKKVSGKSLASLIQSLQLCNPKETLDYDLRMDELAAHLVVAIVLGLAVDTPFAVMRRKLVPDFCEGQKDLRRRWRQLGINLGMFLAHLTVIVVVIKVLSIVFPCFVQHWQFSIEGMFFPALFFSLQSNLFASLQQMVASMLDNNVSYGCP
jgi:hypothetical protein